MKTLNAPYVVDFDRVTKSYPVPNEPDKVVLDGVSLRVRSGQFVSVVGPSGCGKSTLLRQILGTEQPTTGTALVGGVPRTLENRRVGIVFQQYSIFPNRTVLDNIAFGLELDHLSLAGRLSGCAVRFVLRERMSRWFPPARKLSEYRERARGMLDKVGLNPADALKYPHQLSGGMKQRVACAQALIMEPDVLLLDEALGALDPPTRERLQLHLLAEHERTGATMILITHSMSEAVFCAQRVVVLSQYWTQNGKPGEGSRILMDVAMPKTTSREEKYQNPELKDWAMRITNFGMHRTMVVPYENAELTHPDSVRVAG